MSEAKMNPEVKAEWVAALRSGKYEQGRNKLWGAQGFCCLGVLCDMHARATGAQWEKVGDNYYYQRQCNYLPDEVMAWAALDERTGPRVNTGTERISVAIFNDEGATFAQIADAIEAQL